MGKYDIRTEFLSTASLGLGRQCGRQLHGSGVCSGVWAYPETLGSLDHAWVLEGFWGPFTFQGFEMVVFRVFKYVSPYVCLVCLKKRYI